MERKTPTDAVAKGQFFYIIRNKAIFGLHQANGLNVQYLYQDGGRMITSARLVGNVEDKDMLKLLEDADGFRKLVKGIGVTCELAPDSEVKVSKTLCCIQFYGKKDAYASGTTISKEIPLTGAEEYIDLSEVSWSGDDKALGQIRFEFEIPNVAANVSVKYYLNPGFTAPEVIPDRVVDITSDKYKSMISRSVMHLGNLERIKKAIDDAKAGKEVTFACIGGSITQGAGAIPINSKCYAYLSYEGFCNICGVKPFTNVKYVKAGVGGTPSELGMLRYERDVLADGKNEPDIVVIEFAVNDADDETRGACYESLVKKILKGKKNPAVILDFAVFADDFNLQERLSPVGYRHDLPMVSTKNAVLPEFYNPDKASAVVQRNEYFYDQFHPTNLGHRIMADGIIEIFKAAAEGKNGDGTAIGDGFTDVFLVDRKYVYDDIIVNEGSFNKTDEALQAVEMNYDVVQTKEFPYNYHHTEGTEPISIEAECKKLLVIFKDSASPEDGTAEVFADGKFVKALDPHKVGWVHCHATVIIDEKTSAKHKVTLSMQKGDEGKKFTVLGFGIVR